LAIYAWPANVAKHDADWITSLVDWPELESRGESVQASVLTASQDLSDAVRGKLEEDLSIPLPSELKPGQVQIPVDADAAARLDAYVQHAQKSRLKRFAEIEQANREKRASFLSEFRANLASVERVQEHADRSAVEFAIIAVKSCYILNGGALVVIPAILQFAEKGTVSKVSLLAATVLFVVGIFLAALANYLAYRSMFRAGEGYGEEISARATDVRIAYYPPEDPSEDQANIKSYRTKSERYFKESKRLADWGVGTFSLSVLTFLIGVGIIIYGIGA